MYEFTNLLRQNRLFSLWNEVVDGILYKRLSFTHPLPSL